MLRNTLLTVSILLIPCHVHGQQVFVTPEEMDEILANPGMGWQTFHRTSKQDKNLPPWIPSTVHYARWGWRELEPQPGSHHSKPLRPFDCAKPALMRDKVPQPTKNPGSFMVWFGP